MEEKNIEVLWMLRALFPDAVEYRRVGPVKVAPPGVDLVHHAVVPDYEGNVMPGQKNEYPEYDTIETEIVELEEVAPGLFAGMTKRNIVLYAEEMRE